MEQLQSNSIVKPEYIESAKRKSLNEAQGKRNRASGIIDLRIKAARDQMNSIINRREELTVMINRLRQSAEIQSDAIADLKHYLRSVSIKAIKDTSLLNVSGAVEENLKEKEEELLKTRDKERTYIKELFLANDRLENLKMDVEALDYLQSLLKTLGNFESL